VADVISFSTYRFPGQVLHENHTRAGWCVAIVGFSGDALAKRLGVSRSRLYSNALADFIAKHRGKNITARFNAVYGFEDGRLDDAINELQVRSLPTDDKW
jgi:hypothetical protein